jgi:hypothetical protein
LTPDANGNCPTTTISQQGGSASDNNNPQQGHHHKGSNQPTQTRGGQESTVTKSTKYQKQTKEQHSPHRKRVAAVSTADGTALSFCDCLKNLL